MSPARSDATGRTRPEHNASGATGYRFAIAKQQRPADARVLVLVVLSETRRLHFCIDLVCESVAMLLLRLPEEVLAGAASSAVRIRSLRNPPVDSRSPAAGARPNRSTPWEDFPLDGDPESRHPVGCLATRHYRRSPEPVDSIGGFQAGKTRRC